MQYGLPEAIDAFRAGRMPEAELICHQLLAREPNNPDAWNLMGILAGVSGNHRQAVEYMGRAVQLSPQVVEFRKNLARALIHLDQLKEAESVLQPVMASSPNADVFFLWGMVIGQQGNLVGAIQAVQKAVEKAPNEPAYRLNLAELYRRNGDFDLARQSLRKTLELAPNNVDALNNLSGLLLADGRFLEAMSSIQKLLEVNPRSLQAYCNLASLLGAAGDFGGAVKALRNALILQPDSVRAKFQLVNMLIREGELDEAERLVNELSTATQIEEVPLKTVHARILERKGEIEAAWKIVESIESSHWTQPDVAIMRALLQEQRGEKAEAVKTLEATLQASEVAAIEGIGIYFSLGQLYDSLGRFDDAFRAYHLGNENRKKIFVILGDADKPKIDAADQIRKLYAPSFYQKCPVSSHSTCVPIFILGMPRSGTTLIEQILSSHSSVRGAGELTAFQDLISESYSSPLKSSSPLHIQISDPSNGRNCLVPNGWDSITGAQLDEIGDKYLAHIHKLGGRAERITDKMPYNYFNVGLIAKVFPNAQIIHCQRDALDTCLSCYFQNFAAGSHYAFDLKELGQHYREYLDIMSFWKDELKVPMLELRYEEVVHEPETNVRRVLDYCGLDWDPNCLKFYRSERVVSTASYQQVRQPLYTRSVHRWKNYVAHLRPLIEAIGIERH